ncbi:MAG: WecB/TagA/CpsF family glycosyltransferase [Candidatus Binatia bacterium]
MGTTVHGLPVQMVLGTAIHAATMAQVLAVIEETIAHRRQLRIGVVNAAKIVNMRRDQTLYDDVASSDLVLADGMPVVWAAWLLGQYLPERVAGIDLMFGMLQQGNLHHYRVYCLGATDEVLAAVVARIHEEYPHVTVVGAQNGYFSAVEEERVATAISEAQPDILFVGMTSPKKEKFVARWSTKLGVPVCHGVGGSFDIMAGKVQRAPERWQRLGLEWLYRVMQEPRRLWKRYLVTNILFCGMVLRELARRQPTRVTG